VALRFVATSSARPPASDLLDALHHEYDAAAGRALSGGPSAEPADFAPPGGTFLLAYEHDDAVACGGLKTIGPGIAEVKRMYVVPQQRRRGVGRALLAALENAARSMGFATVRLDCERHNWPLYRAAGYILIDDYNDNPFADHWAEKDLMTDFRLAGVDVPRIGLGTNRLTTASPHVTFVREAVAAGVRHIDTAHLYTGADSERAIGEALEGASEDVLVATKGGYRAGEGRPEVLAAQIEQSLRSLRTEAIGLYYLHRVDPETPLEESLGAIKAYVDRGAIRHVGVSEVSVEQVERARAVVPIAAVQNRYNLADRGHDDVIDYCEREGIAFVPYFPLRGGDGPRVTAAAERLGVTENAVKLAWLLRRSPVVLPIPGTLSIEHLRENLGALALHLEDDIGQTAGS
jgi:pyridoxine 4-dehydrogenase